MTKEEIAAVIDRLTRHAAENKDIAPKSILSRDGGPSMDLIAYCDRHNLTLDWAVLGEGRKHRAGTGH